jgi:hypothetical protein
MVFRTKNKQLNNPYHIEINGSPIEEVETFNFLGIQFNNHLNWHTHTNKLSTKLAKVVGILNKLKYTIPEYTLLQIYHALISPHLNYGILVWGNNPPHDIEILQKRALRNICKSKFNAHTDPLYKRLNLLKIADIRKLHETKFFHKLTNKQLPQFFLNDFILTNNETHTTPILTRNAHKLTTPTHRLELFKSSLRYTIVQTINEIPNNLKAHATTHSLTAFANSIKQFILDQYSNTCTTNNCHTCQNQTLN